MQFVLRLVTSCLLLLCCNNAGIMCMEEPPHTPAGSAPRHFWGTPAKVSITVTNYCKRLLGDIKDFDEDDIAWVFDRFFAKNTYVMHNINGNNEPFYKAFTAVLCRCIEHCAHTQHRKPIPYTVITNDDVVYLPLHYHKHIYVLQFYVSNGETNPIFYQYKTRRSATPITVISINIVLSEGKFDQVKVRRLGNKGKQGTVTVTPLPLEDSPDELLYNEKHFYKTTLLNIADTESLNMVLCDLFTAIPPEWHVPREKFYQVLWANALTFIGAGLTRTEVPTTDGRADFILDRHEAIPIIFEFKFNRSAEEALDQIGHRRYYTITDTNVDMVGINIHSKNGEFEVSSLYEHHVDAPVTLKNVTPNAPKVQSRIRQNGAVAVAE